MKGVKTVTSSIVTKATVGAPDCNLNSKNQESDASNNIQINPIQDGKQVQIS